jgi:hypothetical protein
MVLSSRNTDRQADAGGFITIIFRIGELRVSLSEFLEYI